MENGTKKKTSFIQGPISPDFIANAIAKHQVKTGIGAHGIFLGQVRADVKDGKSVHAMEYTAYEEMADKEMLRIREDAFAKFDLICMHIYHSLGMVKTGELCFFVFTSSAHRDAAIEAAAYIVEKVKREVPIFGKEYFDDLSWQWKVNRLGEEDGNEKAAP